MRNRFIDEMQMMVKIFFKFVFLSLEKFEKLIEFKDKHKSKANQSRQKSHDCKSVK
jgi:hypothetical protein